MTDRSPFGRMCVAIDGAPAADAALGAALSLVASGGELVLANALDQAVLAAECTTPYGGDASIALEAFEASQRMLFAAGLARCARAGVRATTVSLDGDTVGELTDYLRDNAFDALVMGTHARRGLSRLLLGSTADALLRTSSIPVLVTAEREHSRVEGGIKLLLVAFDASEAAHAAADFAIAIARDAGARILVAYVHADRPAGDARAEAALAQALERARAAGVPAERRSLHGDAQEALADAAAGCRADIIVTGTHGRSGLTRLRLGSVAEGIIVSATVPVLVVPASAHVRPLAARTA